MIRTRTQAERDAINARAAAWPRPLSPRQRQALDYLAAGDLVYGRHGWHSEGDGLAGFSTQTVASLAHLGLAKMLHRGTKRARTRITPKGREEHRRG